MNTTCGFGDPRTLRGRARAAARADECAGAVALVSVFLTAAGAYAQSGVRTAVANPTRRTMTRTVQLPASIIPDEQVDLQANVSGYVSEVLVDIGSRVTKGDVLVRLDVPEMEDELAQAEAIVRARRSTVQALRARRVQALRQIDTARAEVKRHAAQQVLDELNFERQTELHGANAVPRKALDEAKSAFDVSVARLEIARAEVAGAEARREAVDAEIAVADADVAVAGAHVDRLKTLLDYAVIRAPFDGVITMRGVDRGAFVRSAAEGDTAPLLHIARTDRVRVVVNVPDVDAPWVHVGTEVHLEVRALNEALGAEVARTNGLLNAETRTLRAEIDIENPDGRFVPGAFVLATVKLLVKSALMIPSKALRSTGSGMFVMVAAGNVAQSKPVQVGYDDGIWVEIQGGLDGSDSVITAANGLVAEGQAIKVVTDGS